MKLPRLFSICTVWTVMAVTAYAQMSTFPQPPPLPPATSSSSLAPPSDSANPSPDTGTTTSGKTSGPTSAPAMAASTLSTMESLDDKTPLQDGDTVSFRVIEDRDDAIERVVTDTGEINFPYIGPVKVEGKTCRQAAIDVKKRLEVDYYKQATVILGIDSIIDQDNHVKPRDFAWVMGEVRQVGPQELLEHQPMTVSQLIARAGGFSDFADQRKVKLIHREPGSSAGGDEINNSKNYQTIDVKSIMQGDPSHDPVVKPGDYIIVPKKFINY
jgi:polysaccharide export outer membrane protein